MSSESRSSAALVPIESLITSIRGRKVILDSDLARVYSVTTARLNQQVKRNRVRFPEDFMLQLTKSEFEDLILQSATSKPDEEAGASSPMPLLSTAPSWSPTCSTA